MKLHRKEVYTAASQGGFPANLPEGATVVYVSEKDASPVYIYYTVPE